MKVTLTPILEDLRGLYAIANRFERFDAYASLFSGISRGGSKTRGEPLPLGTFSPMGERQAAYLDQLTALAAEGLAQTTADEVASDFETLLERFRLMLVVANVPRNGWTQRQLTDAEWRFGPNTDALPKSVTLDGFDRWVSVLLWTDTEATETYVEKEVRGALYRALYRRYVGLPNTLAEMIRQEGRVLSYAGYTPELDIDELIYSREIIAPYLQHADFPTCFAALYGDEAAKTAGYEALGLTTDAGFQLALHDALRENRTDLPNLMQGNNTASPEYPKFSGAVLAGGRSSRFNQDKASYLYQGKPLAVWALDSLVEADERFVVSSRPYPFSVPVYPDLYPGSSLGGLHAALTYAKHDWVGLAACDMPFLTPDYWQQLLSRVENTHAVVLTGPEGRLEPLAALYHRSLLPLAEKQLKNGQLKIQAFVREADARILDYKGLELDPKTFFNANYLADLNPF